MTHVIPCRVIPHRGLVYRPAPPDHDQEGSKRTIDVRRTGLLINRLRRTLPRPTDYAVAKALDMSQSRLKRVIEGHANVGPKTAVLLSEKLQMSLDEVTAMIELDKAKTPEDTAFWERRAPRLTASVVVTAVATLAALIIPGNAEAKGLYTITVDSQTAYTLCVFLL